MDAAGVFAELFGYAAAGLWSAPGRVNLIGEHTDYNDGLAMPIAIPARTYAAAAPRADGRLRVHSIQAGETVDVSLDEIAPGRVSGWAAYVAGVPWALTEAGYAVGGIDLVIDGRVPLGAGLSSSAALECAVAAAYSDLQGLDLLGSDGGRAALVSVCRLAENEIAGAPTGGMDQAASLLAREAHALLLDCRDGATEHVPFDLDGAGLVLLVIDTKAHHSLVDGQYGARRASCEKACAALGIGALREIAVADLDVATARLRAAEPDDPRLIARVTHVVTEIDRVRQAAEALRRADWARLGDLFAISHASLRDDYEVSCGELDTAVAAALGAGALGARMTGGGFGGSAIALVAAGDLERIQAGVRMAFADAGYGPPEISVALACDGAHAESA